MTVISISPIPWPDGATEVGEWEPDGDYVTRSFRGAAIEVGGLDCHVSGIQSAFGGEVLWRNAIVADKVLTVDEVEELAVGLAALAAELRRP